MEFHGLFHSVDPILMYPETLTYYHTTIRINAMLPLFLRLLLHFA